MKKTTLFSILSIICLIILPNQSSAFQSRKLQQFYPPSTSSNECMIPGWGYYIPQFVRNHVFRCGTNPQPPVNFPPSPNTALPPPQPSPPPADQSPPHISPPSDQNPVWVCGSPPKIPPPSTPPPPSSGGQPTNSNCSYSNNGDSSSWSCGDTHGNGNSNSNTSPPTDQSSPQTVSPSPKTLSPSTPSRSGGQSGDNCHYGYNGNSYSWSCGDSGSNSHSDQQPSAGGFTPNNPSSSFPWSGGIIPSNCHYSSNGHSYSWYCADTNSNSYSDSNSYNNVYHSNGCTYRYSPDGSQYSYYCSNP